MNDKIFEKYLDLDGNSGITGFAIGADWVEVKFSNNKIYKYSYKLAGKINVDNMKRLAKEGRGLHNYITIHVGFLNDR